MGQGHHHNEHAQSSGPFTQQEHILLKLGHQKDLFSSHHHHHHHHSSEKYIRPKQLTTPVGLYALKKLNAIEPSYLSVREKRLLQPVAPGFISYLIYGSFLGLTSMYSAYIFKTMGYQGFATKAFVPVVAIGLTYKVVEYGLNSGRQLLFSRQRKNLVQKYQRKFGQNYLLDILDPAFKLQVDHSHEH